MKIRDWLKQVSSPANEGGEGGGNVYCAECGWWTSGCGHK